MSQRKKVLVVSLGSIGQRHLRNTRTLLPDAEIAVYKQHGKEKLDVPEGANHLFYDLEDAIKFKPDAVIISSPASEHLKNAEIFAKAGASLFIEKPLAATSSENEPFIKAMNESSKFHMVGYVLRFLPMLHTMKEIIENKELLGEVRTAHVQVGQYLPDWRPQSDYRIGVSAQKKLGGGALLELSHEIDYAIWLFGAPHSLQCSRTKVSDLEIDVEDSAHIVMEYGHKAPQRRVMIQLDFLQRVANMAVQIVGSKATLQADLIKETAKLISPEFPNGKELLMPKLANGNEIYLKQFDLFFFKSFADYKPMFTETKTFTAWVKVEHAAYVMDVVDQAKIASDEGRRITLAEEKI